MSKPELEPIKYQTTAITEAEKADKVTLWSFSAPHMRSFHMAWFSFFVVSGSGIRADRAEGGGAEQKVTTSASTHVGQHPPPTRTYLPFPSPSPLPPSFHSPHPPSTPHTLAGI